MVKKLITALVSVATIFTLYTASVYAQTAPSVVIGSNRGNGPVAMQVGQSITFTSSITGSAGSWGSNTWAWPQFGMNCSVSPNSSLALECTAASAGQYAVYLNVNWNNNSNTAQSNSIILNVSNAQTYNPPVISNFRFDVRTANLKSPTQVGDTFDVYVSQIPSQAVSEHWDIIGNSVRCELSGRTIQRCTAVSTGETVFGFGATMDSVHYNSNVVRINVISNTQNPTISLTSNRGSGTVYLTAGQQIDFTATFYGQVVNDAGGWGWPSTQLNCPTFTNNQLRCEAVSAGTGYVQRDITVTGTTRNVSSNRITVIVSNPVQTTPTMSITSNRGNNATINIGDTVTYNATVNGSSTSTDWTWNASVLNCSETAFTLNCTAIAGGSSGIQVRAFNGSITGPLSNELIMNVRHDQPTFTVTGTYANNATVNAGTTVIFYLTASGASSQNPGGNWGYSTEMLSCTRPSNHQLSCTVRSDGNVNQTSVHYFKNVNGQLYTSNSHYINRQISEPNMSLNSNYGTGSVIVTTGNAITFTLNRGSLPSGTGISWNYQPSFSSNNLTNCRTFNNSESTTCTVRRDGSTARVHASAYSNGREYRTNTITVISQQNNINPSVTITSNRTSGDNVWLNIGETVRFNAQLQGTPGTNGNWFEAWPDGSYDQWGSQWNISPYNNNALSCTSSTPILTFNCTALRSGSTNLSYTLTKNGAAYYSNTIYISVSSNTSIPPTSRVPTVNLTSNFGNGLVSANVGDTITFTGTVYNAPYSYSTNWGGNGVVSSNGVLSCYNKSSLRIDCTVKKAGKAHVNLSAYANNRWYISNEITVYTKDNGKSVGLFNHNYDPFSKTIKMEWNALNGNSGKSWRLSYKIQNAQTKKKIGITTTLDLQSSTSHVIGNIVQNRIYTITLESIDPYSKRSLSSKTISVNTTPIYDQPVSTPAWENTIRVSIRSSQGPEPVYIYVGDKINFTGTASIPVDINSPINARGWEGLGTDNTLTCHTIGNRAICNAIRTGRISKLRYFVEINERKYYSEPFEVQVVNY